MEKSDPTHPRVLNYVELTVRDLDAAIKWYGRLLEFELFSGPTDLVISDEQAGHLLRDVMPEVKIVRVAHLAAGGGTGLGLFQFVEPSADLSANNIIPPRTGFFHICVTDSDPAGLAKRIVAEDGC